MPESTRDDRSWGFTYPIGRLCDRRWEAQIDVSRPQLGLHHVRCGSVSLDGPLLTIEPTGVAAWPTQVTDAYVRGRDLVATYAPSNRWPYAPQLYWSVAEPVESDDGVLASLSLLVSIQTNLLDSHPRIAVESRLAAEEVLRLVVDNHDDVLVESLIGGEQTIFPRANVCCLLRRLPGGQFSYAEFLPASDFRQLSVEFAPGGECRTRWELFAEFLEKGVIRRARVQLALLNRDNDVQLATACCRRLENRPLPLTT